MERRAFRTPLAGLAVATVAVLTVSCSGGPERVPAAGSPAGSEATTSGAPTAAAIKISPAEGSTTVRPDKKVVVTATGGALEEVVVKSGDHVLEGDFDAERTRWTSSVPMMPASAYTVAARAVDGTTAEASFSTLKPKRELEVADVTPAVKGEKIGVGAPIIVTFNQQITNKAAVEKSLQVKSDKPHQGAWRWVNDTTVIYRTAKFWQPHQKVVFTARLKGVQGGKDMYGVKDITKVLRIGAAQISTVDTRKHKMIVKRDGKVVQTMLISAGNASTREYTTTSGIHLAMGKANPERMISPGRKKGDPGYYDLMINHAVRFSNSGEYVHALNNVWAQGRQNVSHGCINARPDQAKWFYEQVQRGDVIKITGTDRKIEWNNGWSYWELSFSQWKKGSALA
ncbi:lipoprotein-anchoring transpeptidase ErfK/SrfK [Streptosporangium becharense]|uniref:Lipoprotein-anchoring transpeptidase ErfK/SrfK n=1 Tax=Streptosporangium becharense TaxID=1816182 RepID=A0A7W9MKG1_9ACTN|nr:Ig-like domain-containing protein [Streptosporangium becharense]MBB2914277.1 lipoprotein-anchoring transpeptidase ErfK/SrfK [Streptosporangium becharense]MBB5823691.1 lipoprotein-anchoring transpeptidase ErfK/SrfK [Streptosporangium becharense]